MKQFTKNAYLKRIRTLIKKEQKFLNKCSLQKDNIINQKLKNKVNDNLEKTLNTAFEKAFNIVFKKGEKIIEKTYDAQKIKDQHTLNKLQLENSPSKKTLKKYIKAPNASCSKNLLITGISSSALGLLGIGIPDIPLFISLIIKNLQEISLSYGFDFKEDKEKYLMLLIIEGALSHDNIHRINKKINAFIEKETPFDLDQQISQTSKRLSKELLYLKFLQGIPIVGTITGIYDSKYMKQISDYAKLKYQYRFLINHI